MTLPIVHTSTKGYYFNLCNVCFSFNSAISSKNDCSLFIATFVVISVIVTTPLESPQTLLDS